MQKSDKDGEWTVYATVSKALFQELKEAGLVPKIDLIVENALRSAINLQRGK
jgi:hypothetical protein